MKYRAKGRCRRAPCTDRETIFGMTPIEQVVIKLSQAVDFVPTPPSVDDRLLHAVSSGTLTVSRQLARAVLLKVSFRFAP